ncbi:hypothetical protein ACFVVX_28425 [Kitasatospora sp. NPDC058170]|uniref:hypothetical protein n=1 Tax=Kitasatospora sp. NPDC058170 TaxID=3346364 RepID=UPI0036DD2A77
MFPDAGRPAVAEGPQLGCQDGEVALGLERLVVGAARVAHAGIVAATGTLPGLLAPFLTGRLLDSAADASAGYRTAFLVAALVMAAAGALALIAIRPERDARRLGLDAPGRP